MEKNKLIQDIRVKRLDAYIKKNFNSRAEFSAAMEWEPTNTTTLLKKKRPFTDDTAEKIEIKLTLPEGYLTNATEEEFIDIKFHKNINNTLDSSVGTTIKVATHICNNFSTHNTDDLIAIKMNDELMYPTINKDELIFIDTSQQKIEDNKIYFFEINGFFQVRRLVTNEKQFVALHIDNENERKKYVMNNIPLSGIRVIGRVVGGIKNYN